MVVVQGDAARLPLREGSVAAIVGSPPYFAGMSYKGVRDDYTVRTARTLIRRWAVEIERVLVDGGRCWVNVPNFFPRPGGTGNDDRWSPAAVWNEALEEAGLVVRDWIVWVQEGAADSDAAWGSYCSPNRVNLRGGYEVIIVASRPLQLPGPAADAQQAGRSWDRDRIGRNDIPAECWKHWTKNVWSFRSETQKGWHPCPYPAELPRRCILLSTWPDELVVDPWAGSNVTGQVASALGRRYVGFDLSGEYTRRATLAGTQPTLVAAHELEVPRPPRTITLPAPARTVNTDADAVSLW